MPDLFDDHGDTFLDRTGRRWTRGGDGSWYCRYYFAVLHVALKHQGRPNGLWTVGAFVRSLKRDLHLGTRCTEAASRDEAMAAAPTHGINLVEWVRALADGRE